MCGSAIHILLLRNFWVLFCNLCWNQFLISHSICLPFLSLKSFRKILLDIELYKKSSFTRHEVRFHLRRIKTADVKCQNINDHNVWSFSFSSWGLDTRQKVLCYSWQIKSLVKQRTKPNNVQRLYVTISTPHFYETLQSSIEKLKSV